MLKRKQTNTDDDLQISNKRQCTKDIEMKDVLDTFSYELHPYCSSNARFGGRKIGVPIEFKNRVLCCGVRTLQNRTYKYEEVRCNQPTRIGICTKHFHQLSNSLYGQHLPQWYNMLHTEDISTIVHYTNVIGKEIYQNELKLKLHL
jgi:hypothetical protein